MNAVFRHVRRNAVAYVALFVALGGTGYAAMSLPKGSVGARQIKNHSIDPVKLNPKLISGNVRAWAVVTSAGKVISGGGKPQVVVGVSPANYAISWGIALKRHCATVVTIDGDHSPTTEQVPLPGNPAEALTAGYAVADSFNNGKGRSHNVTAVTTFNQAGQPTSLGFDVAVVC